MSRDGRAQVIPLPWYLRVWRFLASNPLVGVILALLATVGVQGARLRYRDRRATRLQDAADRERIRLAREQARVREVEAGARQTELDRELDEAEADEATGRHAALDAHERLKALERGRRGPRWPG